MSFTEERIRCTQYHFRLLLLLRKTRSIEIGEYHETLSFAPRLTGLFFQRLVYRGYLPPRIPFDKLRAAVSPISKPRKELRPPASHSRNDFMLSPLGKIP